MSSETLRPISPTELGADQGEGPSLDAAIWRPLPDSELLWQTWDDETVVYNTASGQTHLLDALSAAALREIERSPGTLPQLSRRLAKAFRVPVHDVSQRMPEILMRFDALGLAGPQSR